MHILTYVHCATETKGSCTVLNFNFEYPLLNGLRSPSIPLHTTLQYISLFTWHYLKHFYPLTIGSLYLSIVCSVLLILVPSAVQMYLASYLAISLQLSMHCLFFHLFFSLILCFIIPFILLKFLPTLFIYMDPGNLFHILSLRWDNPSIRQASCKHTKFSILQSSIAPVLLPCMTSNISFPTSILTNHLSHT